MVWDLVTHCLCCDREVLVPSETWSTCERPAAVCSICLPGVTDPMIMSLMLLRGQVTWMTEKLQEVQQNQEGFLRGMEDIEAAVLALHS